MNNIDVVNPNVQVMCRYCCRHVAGAPVGRFVRWVDSCESCRNPPWWDMWTSELVLARPPRSYNVAIRYWKWRRLTLPSNPRIHAWLWWNL
jgi:hypothetical protein